MDISWILLSILTLAMIRRLQCNTKRSIFHFRRYEESTGWALNEEYSYDENGRMENPGFLDYRIPVCSDVPMIDTVIVEVPNLKHPCGVRGVGETPTVPPMAAIANAVSHPTGVRFTQLRMSPPRVLAAIDEERGAKQETAGREKPWSALSSAARYKNWRTANRSWKLMPAM